MRQDQEFFAIEALQDTIRSKLPQLEDIMKISSEKSVADILDQADTPVLAIMDDPARNLSSVARSSTDPIASEQSLAVFRRDPNISVGRFANPAIMPQLGRLMKAEDVQKRVEEAEEFKHTIDAVSYTHLTLPTTERV